MTTATSKVSLDQQSNADAVFDINFWRAFAPNFNIEGKISDYAFPLSTEEQQRLNAKLIKEGYLHLQSPGLKSPIEDMTRLFDAIVARGLPSVFAFVYDEFWMVNTQLRNLLSPILKDDYLQLPDFWAWRVSPGQAGWAPHRDKTAGALFPDKTPKSLTVWIPITQAYPLNGCMYVLPADRDPLYGTDNAQGFPGRLPDIRALPANAGDVLLWTQHVMHWGARSADEHHLPPRMSMAFEYQRADIPAFNKPLLKPNVVPTFEQRLALIAKQVMQYQHMYGFHIDLVAIAQRLSAKYQLPPETSAG